LVHRAEDIVLNHVQPSANTTVAQVALADRGTCYAVRKSSWLMPLCAAGLLGVVALPFAVLPFLLSGNDRAIGVLIFVAALTLAALSAWLIVVGRRTRHCAAALSADSFDLTSFRLIRGRGTRRLASARIAWADVQSLVTESYDLVDVQGLRMKLRNLFVFSRQGDFVLYGYAWQDWDALVADIVARSDCPLNAPVTERSADIESLDRRMRRNYRALRVMSWISVVLLVLLLIGYMSIASAISTEPPLDSSGQPFANVAASS
jgi:hypothetical protein